MLKAYIRDINIYTWLCKVRQFPSVNKAKRSDTITDIDSPFAYFFSTSSGAIPSTFIAYFIRGESKSRLTLASYLRFLISRISFFFTGPLGSSLSPSLSSILFNICSFWLRFLTILNLLPKYFLIIIAQKINIET